MASHENRVTKLEQADGGRGWNLRRLLLRIAADEAGEPLSPELQGEPYGPLVDALTRIGGNMSNLERRLDNLEARQPGADLTPHLVIAFVCPKLGITGARWLDGSTLDRAEDETEAAFRERVTARSAMVFADAKYGGPTIKLLSDDLRL